MSWWLVIKVSMVVALCSAVSVMLFATFLAYHLVKKPSKLLRALEFFIYVPMAMPPIAVGYGLLMLLGPNSFIGTCMKKFFALDIAFSMLGAIIASFTVSCGIGLRAMRLAFEKIDPHHAHRALMMGASTWQAFRYIIFPLCLPSLMGAFVLVFIRSLGEFGATMVLAGNILGQTRTLALAIWTGMQNPDEHQQCLILIIMCAVISLVALLSSELILLRRKP